MIIIIVFIFFSHLCLFPSQKKIKNLCLFVSQKKKNFACSTFSSATKPEIRQIFISKNQHFSIFLYILSSRIKTYQYSSFFLLSIFIRNTSLSFWKLSFQHQWTCTLS
ncbi:hypothetical protein AAZX31_12G139200 [Glycine max]